MDEEVRAVRQLMEGYITAGVIVTEITDDMKVFFSVPSMNDLTMADGTMLKGEDLLAITSEMFLRNGLEPHGTIREEYWTTRMAENAGLQFQGVPCLL